MVSKKISSMDEQKTPIQDTYEKSVNSDSINIDFLAANRQLIG